MTFAVVDERAHRPGATSGWWETWHLDAAGADGIGCSVRLALAPALGVAWWWTHLFLPDVEGAVVVRDHEVGLPRQGLEIRADGLWAELTCEMPFEHWTYGLEAFGVRLDDPAESLRGEIGERVAVGLDIEWEVDPDAGAPLPRAEAGERGYEQFGRVHGEVLLERSRYEVDMVALRSHAWGVPRADPPSGSVWLRASDLAVSVRAARADVDGHVLRANVAHAVSTLRTETHRRADGLPVAARYVLDDELEITTDLLGLVAVPLAEPDGTRSTLTRALCRYDVVETGAEAGDSVNGWSSWLDRD